MLQHAEQSVQCSLRLALGFGGTANQRTRAYKKKDLGSNSNIREDPVDDDRNME